MNELNSTAGEVENFHAFLVRWFRGTYAEHERGSVFAREFEARIGPSCVYITPGGKSPRRDALVGGLLSSFGSNPHFGISISDVKLRFHAGRVFVVTYVEHQRNAKNTHPRDNTRISTVVLERRDDGRFRWMHVHETALA